MLENHKYMLNHKYSHSPLLCASALFCIAAIDVHDIKTGRISALASVNAKNAQTDSSATEVI